MTDENYKELTAAVRESGIPLPLQKELQILIDEEYKQEKMRRQLSPMFNNVKEMIIVEN